MSRVLVTGGAGRIGTAIVRRLLSDPDYEVRVADREPAPQWMREGCEIHSGDLRLPERAQPAVAGCTHVIHLAAIAGPPELAHTVIEANGALLNAVLGAALGERVERFTYVSCAAVFEHSELLPTPEEQLAHCAPPSSAYAFSKLVGEILCRAAHAEHGLPYTICRAAEAYGPGEPSRAEPGIGSVVGDLIAQALVGQAPLKRPGSPEQTYTPTHVQDIAEGVVGAMSLPGGLNEDFNICGPHELRWAEIARLAWDAVGQDPQAFALEEPSGTPDAPNRSWPSARKARELLGWEARIEAHEGIADCVRRLRDAGSIGSRS